MIEYQTHILSNGLSVIAHRDQNTTLACVNLLYAVGSRDESETKTGLAHLFEHLMFGGSQNVADFDLAVQNASGESNAYTTNDLTNYYITLPANNVETAFWLESDRMFFPKLESVLQTQKKVVIEEYRQRYLNQPYGDVWFKIRELAYLRHPYRWATIGRSVEQIEQIDFQDVEDFYTRFYAPSNAILTVVSPHPSQKVFEWAEKWFSVEVNQNTHKRSYLQEPEQTEKRVLYFKASVPQKAIYIAFHCCGADSEDFHATLVLNFIFSRGKSSRLHQVLVKQKRKFVQASMTATATQEPGLLVASGRLVPEIGFEQGYQLLINELHQAQNITEQEVYKAKNQLLTQLAFMDLSPSNRAARLSYHAFLGNLDQINAENDKLMAVETHRIREIASQIFNEHNASVLFYG